MVGKISQLSKYEKVEASEYPEAMWSKLTKESQEAQNHA